MQKYVFFNSDFIGQPPNLITQYGIGVFFVCIVMILVFAQKIEYADVIKAPITIKSKVPGTAILAEKPKVIEEVKRTSGSHVKSNETIVVFKSDIPLSTVQTLQSLTENSDVSFQELNAISHLKMGELRQDFQSFETQLKKRMMLNDSKITHAMIQKLTNHNQSIKQQIFELESNVAALEDKATIDHQNLRRSEQNLANGLIARKDVESARNTHLSARISLNQSVMELIQLKSTLIDNKNEIELKNTANQEKMADIENQLLSAQHTLRDRINLWQSEHLLTSPIEGIISIPNEIRSLQNISAGQEIFSIIPTSDLLIGHVEIPEFGSGYINSGQETMTSLNSYPAKQFGKVAGKIISKSPAIHGQSVFIEVEFNFYNNKTNELITTHGKKLNYMSNMQGEVEIITQKKSVLSRIFAGIHKSI